MSDIPENNLNVAQANTPDTPVDASRRKLAGSALGIAAVFTLASQPVWANQCTISGMQSGNLSKAKGPACEGCTPGFWKQTQWHPKWTGYQPTDKFNTVFGVSGYTRNGQQLTLQQVLDLTGGDDPVFPKLGAHAVAALLNAASTGVNYGYTSGEIINLFRAHYASKAEDLKNSLVSLNQRGCPLGNDPGYN